MPPARRKQSPSPGMGQLTLVEHALCPLDARRSLQPNLVHETTFAYSDPKRVRRRGRVQVFCPLGLSAHDELYLWGLLALTVADSESDGEFHATPHFCLRRLGMIDARSRRGGRQYDQFGQAIERLAAVRYQNESFYDPIRAEHRRVSFGFFSYSLPLDPGSSRAWRFAWDPVFFEFAKAAGGALRFELDTYRELDTAARRLFLFLSKIFARRETTPRLDLLQLSRNVLGLSPTLPTYDAKRKLLRCVAELVEHGVVGVQPTKQMIRKAGVGRYVVVLQRGARFRQSQVTRRQDLQDSPFWEPLCDLGLDEAAIHRTLKQYSARLLREWIDITLAARERFGKRHFKRSPAAFLIDNLKHAARGERTPPDWWHEVRKAEEQKQARRDRQRRPQAPRPESAAQVIDELRGQFFGVPIASGSQDS